jgi:hypothetical protein
MENGNWMEILPALILHCNKRVFHRDANMSMLANAFSAEIIILILQSLLGSLRSLFGIGLAATFVVVFRPLLVGLLRAALLAISPRKSLKERQAREVVRGARLLERMARQLASTQPNLAAEMRSIAARC